MDTAEGVTNTLRPYWEEATGDHASVVQAVPDMLEIIPSGTSKGSGVKMLLDHLGVSPKEVNGTCCDYQYPSIVIFFCNLTGLRKLGMFSSKISILAIMKMPFPFSYLSF